jgi:hypothetical protein
MAGFTITDLKKHLGPGLGLRKNKYLLELPIPGIAGGAMTNILCRSTGLPERNMATGEVWHKGRNYKVRGETDFIGTFEISVVDDSNMELRRMFDRWMRLVDNSKPVNTGILGGSYEQGIGDALSAIRSGVGVFNDITQAINDGERAVDYAIGLVDEGLAFADAKYQKDINVWQLGGKGTADDADKIYGYKLQNAFPSSVGIVTLEDGEENTLSEFSITFTFSEFEPLEAASMADKVANAIGGDVARDIRYAVEAVAR